VRCFTFVMLAWVLFGCSGPPDTGEPNAGAGGSGGGENQQDGGRAGVGGTAGENGGGGLSDAGGGNSSGGSHGGGPDVVLLPGGTSLNIPTAPDVSGVYDCEAPAILCVPSEFATIQAAADETRAGDTVLVSPGRYAGFVVTNTGTADSPIRFIARPGTRIDDFSSSEHGVVLRSDFDSDFYVDHIQVVGFTIESPTRRCIYLTKAIASRPSVGHLIAKNTCIDAGGEGFVLSQMSLSVVEDNVILNAGNGSPQDARDHGIYLSNGGTGDSLVRHNVIMGSSTAGIHFNGDRFVDSGGTDGVITGLVLDGNIVIGNGQNGFNMDGVQDTLFINNVFYGNAKHGMRGYAIDGAEGPKNIVAINNTFIDNASGVKLSDSLGGHVVFNNLVVDMRDEAIVVPDAATGPNVTDAGIAFEALPLDFEHATSAQIAGFDFRVVTSERAALIDQGSPSTEGQSAPAHDLQNNARREAPDIGAVEY
jgi:hypothetical protein